MLLLAAGQSRRFGSDKRLYALNDGDPLAVQSACLYLDLGLPVVPVIRPEDEKILGARLKAAGCQQPVLSDRAVQGMGYSLADGAAYLRSLAGTGSPLVERGRSQGILVALADMPYLKAKTIEALASIGDGTDNIVAPELSASDASRSSQLGNPVRFPWALLDELASLTGDKGARSLLTKHAQKLLSVATTDTGVIRDIDYPPASGSD
ncbi:MAG: nucleotidyltransferase family protein [Pseudomonadaceae bacterium]|nr:nucleotidyltransferase family protein [Pseudomonadaceae bacterium]